VDSPIPVVGSRPAERRRRLAAGERRRGTAGSRLSGGRPSTGSRAFVVRLRGKAVGDSRLAYQACRG
jgi:hypothetical protein